MLKGAFEPNFPLKHQQKDMRLALRLAEETNQSLPLAAATNEVFKQGKSQGLGDNDMCAVYKVVSGEK